MSGFLPAREEGGHQVVDLDHGGVKAPGPSTAEPE